jgi:Rod binding domain-containing protein
MASMIAAPQMMANTSDADAIHKRKMIHAAHEFEALLLNTLLGPLEQTFSSLPGKKPDSESDNYHYLGMQALASTLAAGKGLGIADMIVRSLLPGHAASSGK